jgi:hypothetical protein
MSSAVQLVGAIRRVYGRSYHGLEREAEAYARATDG